MNESTEAVICNNNQLLEQVADLMSKYDTADSKAALGECLAIIVKTNGRVVTQDLESAMMSRLSK
ncbi:MAG: hypothetical protein CMJ75_14015 [Planctomycetaceae bacterium]|nr:hypothetical protein [Planctomycetaceae bacterium]